MTGLALVIYTVVLSVLLSIFPRKAFLTRDTGPIVRYPTDRAVGAILLCILWPGLFPFFAIAAIFQCVLWVTIPEYRTKNTKPLTEKENSNG